MLPHQQQSGKGGLEHSSVAEKKLTLLLEHLPSGCRVSHHGAGDIATLLPCEQASSYSEAVGLQPLMEK